MYRLALAKSSAKHQKPHVMRWDEILPSSNYNEMAGEPVTLEPPIRDSTDMLNNFKSKRMDEYLVKNSDETDVGYQGSTATIPISISSFKRRTGCNIKATYDGVCL